MGWIDQIWLMEGLEVNMSISQYMDLDYLFSLLGSNKYHLKRKKTFEDKNETTLPIKTLFKIQAVGEENSLNKTNIDMEVDLFNKYQESSDTLTSCWTYRKNESVLMWKSFTSKMGACIKSSINNYVSSFNCGDYYIVCGKMIYDGYSSAMSFWERMFSKDKAYSSEKEIRFYFIPKYDRIKKEEKEVDIHVNTNVLIDEVILSPFINEKAGIQLKNIIEEKYKIRTKLSKIII